MPAPEIPQILALLKKTDLLSPAELETAKRLAAEAGTTGSGDGLLQELVARNVLTIWQRDQLLRGESGFVLRQYRILESVGKGGMGHVFKAHDRETDTTVAIKVMARKLTSNQSLVNLATPQPARRQNARRRPCRKNRLHGHGVCQWLSAR